MALTTPRALPSKASHRDARWPSRVALLVAALAAVAWYLACYYGRGLDVPDEGLLLHAAERIAAGAVPYRDIYFIYTPGLQYTLALLFRLFGATLAVEHALLLALAVGMAVTVYALARWLAGWWPLAAVAALVVILAGLNSYRFLLGLLAVAALTAYAARPTRGRLLLAGAIIGVTYLFAQEVGLYALATAIGYLGLDWLCSGRHWERLPRLLGNLALVLAGSAAILVPWLAVLTVQDGFVPMLDATLRVAFLHQPRYMHVPLPALLPLVPDNLDTNVVYGARPYLLYVKALLYLPLTSVVLGIAVFLARLRREDWSADLRAAAPTLGFATLALATIADRADYYHLKQVLPVTLVLLAWLLGQARQALLARARAGATDHDYLDKRDRRAVLAALLALLPFVPLVLVSAGEAWQWRQDQDHLLQTPRGSVRGTVEQARDLGTLLTSLQQRTAPGEAIFVWPAETAIYFLGGWRNPTRFGQLVPTEAEILRERDGAVQREMLAAIRAADVRWGVAAPTENVNGMPFAAYAPLLAEALDAAYRPTERHGYWTLHGRRDVLASP